MVFYHNFKDNATIVINQQQHYKQKFHKNHKIVDLS